MNTPSFGFAKLELDFLVCTESILNIIQDVEKKQTLVEAVAKTDHESIVNCVFAELPEEIVSQRRKEEQFTLPLFSFVVIATDSIEKGKNCREILSDSGYEDFLEAVTEQQKISFRAVVKEYYS